MTETLAAIADLLLHFDVHLLQLARDYGSGFLLILFLVVWAETGLVVAPFLPGDSLLFVAGAVAALVGIPLWLIVGVLIAAALCGDNTNYWIARRIGPAVFDDPQSRWLNPRNLQRTHDFYERHGGKTIVVARFVPLMRTFVPFVAGLGRMEYRKFLLFSVGAAVLWVGTLVPLGYFFGNLEFVKGHLSLIVVVIIAASISPLLIAALRNRRKT
ncbi:MAG: VTT domain-containing protein [Burkholderiales bacterium]|nr:VTT domain-containing protein [Burkholderiales bacterium]